MGKEGHEERRGGGIWYQRWKYLNVRKSSFTSIIPGRRKRRGLFDYVTNPLGKIFGIVFPFVAEISKKKKFFFTSKRHMSFAHKNTTKGLEFILLIPRRQQWKGARIGKYLKQHLQKKKEGGRGRRGRNKNEPFSSSTTTRTTTTTAK